MVEEGKQPEKKLQVQLDEEHWNMLQQLRQKWRYTTRTTVEVMIEKTYQAEMAGEANG